MNPILLLVSDELLYCTDSESKLRVLCRFAEDFTVGFESKHRAAFRQTGSRRSSYGRVLLATRSTEHV